MKFVGRIVLMAILLSGDDYTTVVCRGCAGVRGTAEGRYLVPYLGSRHRA